MLGFATYITPPKCNSYINNMIPYRWYISREKNFTNFAFQKKIIHRKQKFIWFTPYFWPIRENLTPQNIPPKRYQKQLLHNNAKGELCSFIANIMFMWTKHNWTRLHEPSGQAYRSMLKPLQRRIIITAN